MLETIEIKPKKGLGNIFFGYTMSQIQQIVGPAEEIETIDEDGTPSIIWHYWNRGYSLFFDPKKNNSFNCVEIDNARSILFNTPVFEMSEPEVIALFKKNGFGSYEVEDQDWGERRVSFDDAMVDCYFENGILISINYGVFFDDNRILLLPN